MKRRIAITALTAAALTVPLAAAPAIGAPIRGGLDAYAVRLLTALELCQKSVDRPDDPETLTRCVAGLAAPNPRSAAEIDLFRVFTNCLAEAAGSDSMYPGVDPAEVNQCLEDWGVY